MVQYRLAQHERMKDMEEVGIDREKDLRNTDKEEEEE